MNLVVTCIVIERFPAEDTSLIQTAAVFSANQYDDSDPGYGFEKIKVSDHKVYKNIGLVTLSCRLTSQG